MKSRRLSGFFCFHGSTTQHLKLITHHLFAISYQLSAISYSPSAMSHELSVIPHPISAISHQLIGRFFYNPLAVRVYCNKSKGILRLTKAITRNLNPSPTSFFCKVAHKFVCSFFFFPSNFPLFPHIINQTLYCLSLKILLS